MNKVIIRKSAPTTIQSVAPEFIKSDFEEAIWSKGLSVVHEKTIKCPCKSKESSGNLTTCQNCQGTGWVVIDATSTKMLMSSINSNTKYKSWGEENMGTVSITAMDRDKVSFMDKITLVDSEAIMSELIYPFELDTNRFAYTIYNPISIINIFMFVSSNSKLMKLLPDTHYTIDKNKIILNPNYSFPTLTQISVRYTHNLVFGIVDTPHDIRNSYVTNSTGKEESVILPVSAIGRRFHYLIDAQNFNGDNIFDNSVNTTDTGGQTY